ncbi:hypothetical protein [Nocardia sp. CNY236]|uniref:hypothetical protein n=1 Tax=Nocardia sp. CNY236 TaxID=1169152 RepID=UPI0012DE4DD0|nr:hypothetical protein [Nocardia sp. CNY236]
MARNEGRCDWPFCGFPATVTPERVVSTIRSYMDTHPDIDRISFTSTDRRHGYPLLDAHIVRGQVDVRVAPLHHATAETCSIVDHLHNAILTELTSRPATITVTLDRAGLKLWAQSVIAQAPADSNDLTLAHSTWNLLHGDRTSDSDT